MSNNKEQAGAEEYYRAGCLLSQVAANYELAWLYPSMRTKPSEAFCSALQDVKPIFSPLAPNKEAAETVGETAQELRTRWKNDVFRSPKHLGARAGVFACPTPAAQDPDLDPPPKMDVRGMVTEAVLEILRGSTQHWPHQTDWGDFCIRLNEALKEQLWGKLFALVGDDSSDVHDSWFKLGQYIPLSKDRVLAIENGASGGSVPAREIWEETRSWYFEQTMDICRKTTDWTHDQLHHVQEALSYSFAALEDLIDFAACLRSALDHPWPGEAPDVPKIQYEIDYSIPNAMEEVLRSDAFCGDLCDLLENGVNVGRSGDAPHSVWFILGIYMDWSKVRLPCFLPPPLRDRKKLMGDADEPKEVVRWALHTLNRPLLFEHLSKKNWVKKVKQGLERDFDVSLPDHAHSYAGKPALEHEEAGRQTVDPGTEQITGMSEWEDGQVPDTLQLQLLQLNKSDRSVQLKLNSKMYTLDLPRRESTFPFLLKLTQQTINSRRKYHTYEEIADSIEEHSRTFNKNPAYIGQVQDIKKDVKRALDDIDPRNEEGLKEGEKSLGGRVIRTKRTTQFDEGGYYLEAPDAQIEIVGPDAES